MMRAAAGMAMAVLLGACQTVAPAKDTSLANVQVVTSPGGVTAWLVSESHVPIIAVEMAWRGGSTNEPRGKDGAGWVLAYMMNEGAGKLDTTEYGARMQDLNMQFACGVSIDWTTCSMSTLKETAAESFDMVRMAFAEPRFDREPFDRAKRELTVSVKQAETEPRRVASRAMNEALIPGHPYARYATPETIEKVSRTDIKNLKQSLMTKDRLLVVVVGDISAEELKPRLDQMFGALPAGVPLPPLPDAVARPAKPEPVVKVLPQPQTMVMFSGPGIKREDPDFFAAYLLNYMLGGGGISSRLSDDLREKRGLTYGVATGFSLQPNFWRWTGSTSTQNDKADEAVALIRENIGRLGRDGPTQKELDDAKAYVTGAFALAFDSNAKIARNLLGFRQDNLAADYVHERNAIVEAVTLEDVKRVAAKYMKPEAFTFVMVGQPALD
jgi:zinc protease